MNTLLIEIGSEQIPAGYIVPALEAFSKQILDMLDSARIDHGQALTLGTPRRLVLMVKDVGDMQNVQTSTITGPPEKIAFDKEGNPTVPAQKFAQKAGIPLDQITVEDTPKGRYLTAVVQETCESAITILEQILEKAILSIPFPKSMRWGDLSISFARPIISLTGLLGSKCLDFGVGNIRSSSFIFGHQFMNPEKYELESADAYVKTAESAGIIPGIEKRKDTLVTAIEACAISAGAVIQEDEELIDLVTNLVEYPYPVVGTFDETFLQVPDEVLITAMREHQKYFALRDETGKLKNQFIAVNNTKAKDMALVTKGHEKVLRARLSDAKFFYETDQKSSLDEFAQKLKQVTFQEKLGTVYDKTLRVGALAQFLVNASSYDDREALARKVDRAAKICKADLVSQVVIEFTKLQGVIGRAYALKAGEDKDVACAIEQHYRPVYSGGSLPENPTACILAIADKLDTICGCFSVGLIPTGGTDPYGLRRQGIGILGIMMDQKLEINLTSMIEKGLSAYSQNNDAKTVLEIKEFLQNRMLNLLVDTGYSKEAVNSALGASFDNIPDVVLRVRALDALRKEPDFEPLSITFKRVENILRKSGQDVQISVNENLFEDASESGLFAAVLKVKNTVDRLIENGVYDEALTHIAGLRPVVDTFFDDVMVMAEDDTIRQNRMALLSSVSALFKNIADFTKI
ncbi:MAG: glycine--tRNA ligase subunit beta [Proteobacteria bacterium]|nr:glycine--tRNA ligase subunit beta [Pseudomonadota bacterium]MBU1387018.1 glycine--tRNA ligase subunit beta [Pseudomonadota bacterium]MBU1542301.1 glycine--tRNA ligase subunit beta [Pseudomonadota bacterium]MBU2479598.1 glycine--tRNA ligase subunit beta [Pseudomonadota bacterium]